MNTFHNLYSKSGQNFGKELDHLQVSPNKNSGKKPDPGNPEKNPDIKFPFFGLDFKNGRYKLVLYGITWIFFCDLHKF